MPSSDAVWGYASDLQRFASYLCRHPEDAEDVAQNTLMKAAQHIEGFRGEASVRTWLHTIATNECRMLRRREALVNLESTVHDLSVSNRQLEQEESLAIVEGNLKVVKLQAELDQRLFKEELLNQHKLDVSLARLEALENQVNLMNQRLGKIQQNRRANPEAFAGWRESSERKEGKKNLLITLLLTQSITVSKQTSKINKIILKKSFISPPLLN